MALTTGNDYDHIDISDGTDAVRHYLKDTVARNDLIKAQSSQPSESGNKIWFPDTTPEGVEVPTYAEFSDLKSKLNDITSQSKNLMRCTFVAYKKINSTTGEYQDSAYSSGTAAPEYIPVDSSTNYTISGDEIGTTIIIYWNFYDSSKSFVGYEYTNYSDSSHTGITKAAPNNAKFVRFSTYRSGGDAIDYIPGHFQLEKGSTATAYVDPYSVMLDVTAIDKNTAKAYFEYLTSNDITGKADKVVNAKNGDFAGLDNNGNLTDSGRSSIDFVAVGDEINTASSAVGYYNYLFNAINARTYTTGKYVKYDDGTIADLYSCAASDYIQIPSYATKISTCFKNNDNQVISNSIAFYDESKQYISGLTGAETLDYSVPSGAKYIRCTILLSEISEGVNHNNHYIITNINTIQNIAEEQSNQQSEINEIKNEIRDYTLFDFIRYAIENNQYTSGYYVKISDGTLGTLGTVSVTDYIEIPAVVVAIKAKFFYNNITQGNSFVFYDSSKVFISGYSGTALSSLDIPLNAKYIRFNIGNNEISSGVDTSNHYLVATKQRISWLHVDYNTIIENHLSISVAQHIIAKPYNFNGGKLVIFGDSIAYGYASNPLEPIENPWIKQFCSKANATLIQKAVSASTLAVITGHSSIYEVMNTYSGETPDIIIIAGGTNDYGNNVPVGSYSDTGTGTVYGAMNKICNVLSNSFAGIPAIFITPINRTITTEAQLEYFDGIRNAIYEIASKNGHSVIDGSRLGFTFSPYGDPYRADVLADGVHPTIAGHKMYANAVCGLLL